MNNGEPDPRPELYLWGERGLVASFFLDVSADPSFDRWEEFLHLIHFPANGKGDRNLFGSEVAVQARFLHGSGDFDTQQVATVPQVKLVRKLGNHPPDQLALVEATVRSRLGL